MSKKVDGRTGMAKTSLLSAGALLAYSAAEALKAGEVTFGVFLLAGALAGVLGHELLSQRQFAYEDEFAALLGDGEALAEAYEELVRENQDEIETALEVVAEQGDSD